MPPLIPSLHPLNALLQVSDVIAKVKAVMGK